VTRSAFDPGTIIDPFKKIIRLTPLDKRGPGRVEKYGQRGGKDRPELFVAMLVELISPVGFQRGAMSQSLLIAPPVLIIHKPGLVGAESHKGIDTLRIFVLPFIKVIRIGPVFTIAHAEDAVALGTIFSPYRKKSHQDKSRQKK